MIGHIVGCFLALRLEVDLQRRLDAKGLEEPASRLPYYPGTERRTRDLARLQAVIVDLDGTRYRLRTDCRGHAAKAFQVAGVAVPTEVTPLGPVPAQETPAASVADPLPL